MNPVSRVNTFRRDGDLIGWVSEAQIEEARRAVTPDLLADGMIAGNIAEVTDELRGLVGAALRHVVIWNIGPLAMGASPLDLLRLATLIRRLRKLPLPIAQPQ